MDVVNNEPSQTAKLIWLIGAPIILIVGIIGNGITLVVFLNPKEKKYSTSIYLIWLAIADSMVLLMELPRWCAIYLFRYDVRHFSNLMCKLHMHCSVYPSTLSSWVLMALTVERLISVIRPHQMKTMCTPMSANLVGGVVIVITVLLSACTWYGYGLTHLSVEGNMTIDGNMTTPSGVSEQSSGAAVCTWYRDENSAVAMAIDQIVQFFVGVLCIEVAMTIADVIIIYKLSCTGINRSSKQTGHIRQITITLVTVNIAYILLRTPIFVFMSFFHNPELNEVSESFEIAFAIINMFYFTNHAINFFLYVLIGKRFRTQVMETLGCGRGKAEVKQAMITNDTAETKVTEVPKTDDTQ